MSKKTEQAEVNVTTAPATAPVAQVNGEMSYEKKDVIERLLKNGAKQVKDVTVKNVHIAVEPTYVRVSMTLDKSVDGYMFNEESGEYEAGKTNVVFVSLFSLVTAIKDNQSIAFLANRLLKNPEGAEVLLSYCKIDMVQEYVHEDDEYYSPWTGEFKQVIQHDSVFNHVVSIELSKDMLDMIPMIKLKMLGL